MQPTLVAYYGEKPDSFMKVIHGVQSRLHETLPAGAYVPYSAEQVHSTIVSLAGVFCDDGTLLNKNFLELQGRKVTMDLAGALDFIRSTDRLPMAIRIGGYRPSDDFLFTSNGRHPYHRSFVITNDTAMLMGWPYHEGGRYLGALHRLRCEFKQYSVLHKYFSTEGSFDDDFYVSLGKVHRDNIDPATVRAAEARVRAYLAAEIAIDLQLATHHMSVVGYTRRMLSLEDSIAIPITDATLDEGYLRKNIWGGRSCHEQTTRT